MYTVKAGSGRVFWAAITVLFVSISASQASGGGDEINFNIRMPSEVNIEAVKTIAILPVQGDDFHRFNDSLRVQLLAGVRDDLNLLRRDDVSRGMVEAGIDPTLGLMIEEDQLKAVGSALGADALMYGTSNDLEVRQSWERQTIQVQRTKKVCCDKKGKLKKKTVTEDRKAIADVQEGVIDVSLRVFHVGAGRVLIERNLQKNSTHTRVRDKDADKKLRKKLPSSPRWMVKEDPAETAEWLPHPGAAQPLVSFLERFAWTPS